MPYSKKKKALPASLPAGRAGKAVRVAAAKESIKIRGLLPGLGLPDGIKDILPREQKYWQLIRQRVEQLANDYGFERIDLPIMEKLPLFEKGLGKQSDILTKEIIFFSDKDGTNLALRPTATFSVVRAYLEHRLGNLPKPVKLYYLGPMFRSGLARSGQQRQFYQFGFEVLGSPQPVIDAQLILMAFNFYRDLAVPATIQINSVGCPVCRPEYHKALNDHYRQKKNLLCPACKEDFAKNPLKIFNCQQEKCKELREEAPQIIDHLCEDCKNHFIKLLEYLDELELPYILNSFLIKETTYGTKTVFEIWPEEMETNPTSPARLDPPCRPLRSRSEASEAGEQARQAGGQLPLASGGRYDHLAEALGGDPTPAAGWAAGFERTILKLKEEAMSWPRQNAPDVFIAQLGELARRKALVLFENLREKGVKVAESFSHNGLKLQLEQANKLGVKFTLVLGQKEVLDNTIMIRDMEGGTQELVDFTKIALEIQKRLKKE
ncbi:MAG: HisS family protein [bacterium]